MVGNWAIQPYMIVIICIDQIIKDIGMCIYVIKLCMYMHRYMWPDFGKPTNTGISKNTNFTYWSHCSFLVWGMHVHGRNKVERSVMVVQNYCCLMAAWWTILPTFTTASTERLINMIAILWIPTAFNNEMIFIFSWFRNVFFRYFWCI